MGDWNRVLLKKTDTMERAIEALNREALQIVLVVEENRKLIGTVTDGDIRRALVHHLGMDTPLEEFMFREPTVATIAEDRSEILAMMKQKDLLRVPIVDHDGRVVGLESLQHLLVDRKIDNPVFLMAGGFGKRLRPLTNDVPKPLLKIGEKPILERILERFVDAGFHNFYISTHYKAEMVRNHFGDGSRWGVNITYVHEESPLGTGGALGLLPDELPDLPIIIMNGDLLTKVNFECLLEFHKENEAATTLCVREYDFQVPFGVLDVDGHLVTGITEKPVHHFFVNAGIYVLEPKMIQQVGAGSYIDMPVLLEQQIGYGEKVCMFPIHEYWIDIGRIDEFERAKNAVRNGFTDLC